METSEMLFSIFLGIGLAAAVGFRVFLPLLVLSISAYLDWFPLSESWIWAGSLTSVITLSVATLVEIFAYYIPWVDNLLDTIAVPLAAIAGTAVMMATVSDLNPLVTWSLAIIAGGGTAAVIKGNTAAIRLTSSATTGGMANPIVATAETGSSILMSFISILFAPLAIILVLVIFYVLFKFYKKLHKKKP